MVSHAPSRMMRLGLTEWRRGGNPRIVPGPLFTVVRTKDWSDSTTEKDRI